MTNPRIKTYKAKNGAEQFKPSVELLQELDDYCSGFCLACGETEEGVEPDAVRYTCSSCGANKVYGAGELALRGLCF